MVSVAPNHIFAWALGADSAIYWKYSHSGGNGPWSGWNREAGIWAQDPVVGSRGLGEAAIFLLDTKHALHHANYNFMKDDGVSPFKSLGGKLSSPPGVANRKGILHIFHIGIDHVLYHKSWDGSKYTPEDKFEELGGSFIYSPAAVSAGADEVSVFAVGLEDGRLHHYHWKSNTGWRRPGESFFGSYIGKLPGLWVGTPSAISLKEGSWDVFGVNPKGKINHLSYRDGDLSGLEVISGQDFQTVNAISVTPGMIDLVGWGVDSAVYHKTWDSKTWGEWENLQGTIVHRPSSLSYAPGVLSVVGVGTSCNVVIKSRIAGKWGDWVNLEGILISGVA